MKKVVWTNDRLEALESAFERGGLAEVRRCFPEEANKSTLGIYAKRAAQRRRRPVTQSPYLVKPCADGSRPFGDNAYSGPMPRTRRVRREINYKDVA